jgi:uncharacterized protein YxeA
MIKNKKGAEGSNWTLILLIVGAIALFIIIYAITGGFTKTWANIIGTSTPWTKDSVNAAKTNCGARDLEAYCLETVSVYNSKTGSAEQVYCYDKRIGAVLRFENGTKIVGPTGSGDRPSQCEPYQV